MTEFPIEQAIVNREASGELRIVARSPGFADSWDADAVRLCKAVGTPPVGLEFSGCLFVQPLTKEYVAVVRLASSDGLKNGDAGRLRFHLLVLSQRAYSAFGGDPFALAKHITPVWNAQGALPAVRTSQGSFPPRGVGEVRRVLQQAHDMSTLLGGAQALLDGAKIVFVRPGPDERIVVDLWMLLPTATRCQLWPATFAFGNDLRFDVAVAAQASSPEFAGYLSEQQAGDYPEGRYELSLQTAAETENQAELDSLFARRTRQETWRLGVITVALGVIFFLVVSLLLPSPPSPTLKKAPPPKHAPRRIDGPI